MTTYYHWKTTLLTGLLTLLTAGASLAQQQMNYQGRLTDSAGNAVPDAQYSIIFDIYDSATGGINKWGPQTIPADVVQGRFNVILGPTDTGSRNIVSAFDGGTRYLQITYQGNPILPRQQILSAPTAFFAQNAGQLANVFVLNGNVGIGTTTPGFPLNFADALGDKISLYGQSGNSWGFGIQNQQLQIHSDSSAGDILFGYGSSAAMTETMRIKGNGAVAIGNGPATTKKYSLNVRPGLDQNFVVRAYSEFNGGNGIAGITLQSANDDDNQFNRLQLEGSTLLLNAFTGGNVGIGTTTPGAKLDVRGDIKLGSSGQHYAPAAGENLRIVRGELGTSANGDSSAANTGSIRAGAGFTSARTPTFPAGDYTINFSTPFSSIPTVTVSPAAFGIITATVYVTSTSAIRIVTYNTVGGYAQDWPFTFIAIGPR